MEVRFTGLWKREGGGFASGSLTMTGFCVGTAKVCESNEGRLMGVAGPEGGMVYSKFGKSKSSSSTDSDDEETVRGIDMRG